MSRRLRILGLFAFLFAVLLLPAIALAQQTLGGITGVVTDATGGLVPGAAVDAIGQETGLKRSQTSGDNGYYAFVNLPIGHYTLTVTHAGFQTQVLPDIAVQADRTATLNVTLSVGEVTTSMTVNATPLMNAVDTTVGYVLDKAQLEAIPLPTGSFTGVAALSPGVNIEFSGGTGANSGLGNAPIWANGQRDTSNSFLINGVDASNLFNGKSTSQVSSFRVVNNTGEANNGGGGVVPSSASVYLAIGNAMPTPAPETIEEIRVNSSMYDAQEGSTSGAHIDMSTKSGTNTFHGSAYFHHGTNWLNAAPFFFKKDSNIPANDKNPQLHRYTAGAEIGGPIVKDKLFGFLAYQRLQISDQETGDELTNTIPGLSSTNRDPIDLANLINNNWTANEGISGLSVTAGDWADNPVGLGLFKMKNATTVAGDPGNWLIPNQTPGDTPNIFSPYNTFLPGTATFKSDQAVADLDWNASQKDTLSVKYYYQHDPSTSPYAYSNVPGFTAKVDAGSQVFSINNAEIIRSNFNLTETVAFLREKAYSSNDQPFTPAQVGMSGAFGTYFPGITINDALGDQADSFDGPLYGLTTNSLSIGPDAASQGSNTGVFQNRIMPSANAIWNKGKHTVTFGGSYGYTQLNVRDQRTGYGRLCQELGHALLHAELHRDYVPTGQRQPLLPRQPARRLRRGQVPGHAHPQPDRGPALRLERRTDGEEWQPVQLQPGAVPVQRGFGQLHPWQERVRDRRGQRRQQHHAHRPPVGTRTSHRPRLATVRAGQQAGRPRRHRHLLRSRRTVHLSLARLCCRRDHRRAQRRQPD